MKIGDIIAIMHRYLLESKSHRQTALYIRTLGLSYNVILLMHAC